jgi:hypothetical protein
MLHQKGRNGQQAIAMPLDEVGATDVSVNVKSAVSRKFRENNE